VRLEGLGNLKKIIYLIGSRTSDLPACSIVPQPLLYRVPLLHKMCLNCTGLSMVQQNGFVVNVILRSDVASL
jgi:hypothetical protein